MSSAGHLVAIGEVLWDSMPGGLFPGGAALNIAHDLCALGHPTHLVSRVGRDVLGEELLARLERLGIPAAGVTISPELPTGFVRVRLSGAGLPEFEIVERVAWDEITIEPGFEPSLESARGVIFGALAQRSSRSRQAIRRAWSAPGFKCCDVNLRPPFDDRGIALESLEAASIVKLNHEELGRLADWAGLPPGLEVERMRRLAARFGIATLCVTRGERGAALLQAGEILEHPGYRVAVADTVGAGDAFLAGLLDGLLRGEPVARWLPWANLCGAYVAARWGATPPMSREAIVAFGSALRA